MITPTKDICEASDIEKQKYMLVGRYVVEFEHLVHSLRAFCRGVILVTSNGSSNIHIANSIVVDLAAYQMSTMAERLLFSFFHGKVIQDQTRKEIKKEFNEIAKIIEKRNLFVHGLWLIDSHYAQGRSQDTMTYMKDKKKRDGVDISSEEITLSDFELMIQNCRDFAVKIEQYSKIIYRTRSLELMGKEFDSICQQKP
ncbi:TPA: hypothetical protein QDZ95_003217 [Shewanella algae]|uniref:hypothetical protein n=1 Tax=Shewanella algae TaxID=38313 RepID=UPI001C56556E|nr:hypothetical protein [Shewanella algae]HDS1199674.1 hypothetical protein [Shewanella algae]